MKGGRVSRVDAVQELRRSNAAGTHRTHRDRPRDAQRRDAIRDQKEEDR